MTRDHYIVQLIDRDSGEFVDAELYEGLSDENLRQYTEEWKPLLDAAKRKALAARRAGENAPMIEDGHWDWPTKHKHTSSLLSYRHFVIERSGQTQGMMQLEMAARRSRIEEGRHLVYVDYLAAAPWNRPAIRQPPRYKLVGSLLIRQAIGTSLDEEFAGRVGLHSLPGAAGWYRRLGMTSFGADAGYYGLEYFEFSSSSAHAYLDDKEG